MRGSFSAFRWEKESTLSDEDQAADQVGDQAAEQVGLKDLAVDPNNLYREESYTDLKVATIRCMYPIKSDGSPDASRPKLFSAQTTLMSQAGPVPVQAPLHAETLAEAIEKFPQAINDAVAQLVEEAREMQRQEASRIVMPGQIPGSKIHMP